MDFIDDKKELIRAKALELGFDACGFAIAERVDEDAIVQYLSWIENGKNDCMDYAAKYIPLRNDPRELFPGAKTMICAAMNYYPAVKQPKNAPQFSYYAYGKDYHDVVRNRLKLLARFIKDNWGADSRACVDTAPVREKYWARKAGVGMIGRNNMLIIPGKGSYFFLGELITKLEISPDAPCTLTCGDCNECVDRCPGGALAEKGSLDARRCLSCQLIENRRTLLTWVGAVAGNQVYGCDECQKCCPHNKNAQHTDIPEFTPDEKMLSLTLDDIILMTDVRFKELFGKSAVKRVKLEGLKRNAQIIAKEFKK